MLIDTHAHLYWDSFKTDLDQVIQNALDSGITTIINVGVDPEKSRLAKELDSKKIKFYSTIGIHPHEAIKYTKDPDNLIPEDIQALEKIYHSSPQKVIGIGECGLDFLFESNPDWNPNTLSPSQIKDLQGKLLFAQVKLAAKLNLPLVIHCRNAWKEIWEYLWDTRGILHCYSGSPDDIQKAINSDYLVSFAANITYPKNEFLRVAVKTLPLEKICLETDSPFLSPQNKRGQRNEPSSVKAVAELISELKKIPFEQVAKQTSENVRSLFKLTDF